MPIAAVAQDADMLARYQFTETFESNAHARLVYNARLEPHWIDGAAKLRYRAETRGKSRFVVVNAERGTKRSAFDHRRLAKGLSDAAGSRYYPDRLPFRAIEFVDDMTALRVKLGSQFWRCDLRTYECARTQRPAAPEKPGNERDDPQAEGASPDGRWMVILNDHNIFVRERGSSDRIALSNDGTEDSTYGHFRWSPDSSKLVAFRTEPGDHLEMYTVESSPEGGVRPKLHTIEYALPGDKLDAHEMWVFHVASRKATKVDTWRIDWGGPPGVRWSDDGATFTFERTYRGYGRACVTEVDATTGETRDIIDERNTFIPPQKKMLRYLDETHELIWASERDGWNHLYLYDAATGNVKNQITVGEWVVRGIEKVDEDARTILIKASGREEGQDPYLIHYYRINFDGSGLVALTEGDGTHSISFSPDGMYYVDTYSRVDLAPVHELRRVADGSLVCEIERTNIDDLLATGWRYPEPFSAKGRDGETDIWGVIYRPNDLDESTQYPVIESIYAGPHGSHVPKSFNARHGTHALAQLGFITVQIDGMGTSNRSKAFHDVSHKNLGDGGFPDRILWMKAAGEKYSYFDLSRVGIHGHSAGGYDATRALLAHGDFYKVAISGAGNHDHRTDKVWWNELWMDYPVGDHYAEQSNVTNAHKLTGKLLLMHGELDTNVNPHASTMQLVNALIKANKDFDMLILPGDGHGFSGTYAKRKSWDFWTRHLLGLEPPKEYEFAAGNDAGAECNITIKNSLDETVVIYWLNFEGELQKYHDLKPGAEIKQHTYVGHEWEAEADGAIVSHYAASKTDPVWEIRP